MGERLPKHLWFRGFRIEQGGYSDEDILYQDNEAAILVENNGRYSCKKGMRHIHIRYFFVTDRIKNKEIKVMCCPTEEMVADFFTKPPQGKLFFKFRNIVLGIDPEDHDACQRNFDEVIKKHKKMEEEQQNKGSS